MNIEERIEKAVAALDNLVIDNEWRGNDDTAYCVIRAAFPELFDGTAWLAPVALTPAAEATIAASLDHPSVYMGGPSQQNRRNARRLWDALTYEHRARLNSPPSS